MSEVKHTPGPWTAFYKSKYDEWHVSLPMSDCGMKLALAPDGIQSENRKADAHLIAAAPDMLAALKAFIAAIDRAIADDDVSIVDEITDEIENAARAAIAKAQGRP